MDPEKKENDDVYEASMGKNKKTNPNEPELDATQA